MLPKSNESILGEFWSLAKNLEQATKEMRVVQYAAYITAASYQLRGYYTTDVGDHIVGAVFFVLGLFVWRRLYFVVPFLLFFLVFEAAGTIILRVFNEVYTGLVLPIFILGICFVSLKGWLSYRNIIKKS